MAKELITARDLSQGMHVPIVYVNDITGGIFMGILLIAVWSIVTFGMFFTQKKTIGNGDFPMCVAVAGFVTAILTTILRIIPGLVDGTTFAIVIVVALISILWFFFSRD